METQADRLRRARVDAGFDRAADAARRFGWNTSTYYAHENGSRNFKVEQARDYARAFKVTAEWLLIGGDKTAAGGELHVNEGEAAPFHVEPGGDVRAIPEVRYFDLAPEAESPALYVVHSRRHAAFGLLPGDVLVVDRRGTPREGDLVVAVETDRESGEASTLIRRYAAGVLIDADPGGERPAIAISEDRIDIIGPVVSSARRRYGAHSA